MPVAKSFQNLEQVGASYKINGKDYVDVLTKLGTKKAVRLYTDAEYARMYPEAKVDKTKDPYYRPQKYVLGFEKGYITIFIMMLK